MSGIEVPALRGRPCTVTLPPRATPIMLGIHPYSVACLTSIVQRTGFFAFVADLRHVSIVSRLSRNSLSVATIASQRSGAAARINRCPPSHCVGASKTRVATPSGHSQLSGVRRAIGPANAA